MMKRIILVPIFVAAVIAASLSSAEEGKSGQPFIFYGERVFEVGTLNKMPSDSREAIPKIDGAKIYNYEISDGEHVLLSIPESRSDLNAGASIGINCFFPGHYKSYLVNRLTEENPGIEWLKTISRVDFPVLEVEQIIPLENNASVMTVDIPDDFADELEILVTVTNPLDRPLADSRLEFALVSGPFKIMADRPATSQKIIDKFTAGETKVFKFKIKKDFSSEEKNFDLEFKVTFAGYGMEGNEASPKIFPVFAQKKYTYQVGWKIKKS